MYKIMQGILVTWKWCFSARRKKNCRVLLVHRDKSRWKENMSSPRLHIRRHSILSIAPEISNWKHVLTILPKRMMKTFLYDTGPTSVRSLKRPFSCSYSTSWVMSDVLSRCIIGVYAPISLSWHSPIKLKIKTNRWVTLRGYIPPSQNLFNKISMELRSMLLKCKFMTNYISFCFVLCFRMNNFHKEVRGYKLRLMTPSVEQIQIN